MSKRLCFDFLEHADWVWRRIANAERHGFPFGEETITETVLLDLKLNHPNRVFIQPFTKRKERWNGADWEWWIGRDGNWIGMRVQAKRISLPKESYKSLFYQSDGAAKMQIEYLIEQAEKANPPLVPIYTLYTHSANESALQTKLQHCDAMALFYHSSGCLVAHAQDIENLGSLTLSEIATYAFPWHCLVCTCLVDSHGPDGPADHIARLLGQTGDLATAIADRAGRFAPEVQSDLPKHIQLLRSGDDFDGRYLDKYAEEWDLGGLALFDLGAKDDE